MNGGPLPWCDACGRRSFATTTRFGERCACSGCGRWSWQRRPLATARTHQARKEAHEVFDALWRKPALLTRSDAYARLARILGLPPALCHVRGL